MAVERSGSRSRGSGTGALLPRPGARRLGLGAHTLFIGYLDRHRALNSCYRAADVFVFASRTETQGLVLLEAMVAGVPLIGTDCGGGREVVQGSGRLFPLGDAKALAAELIAEAGTVAELPTKRLCMLNSLQERFSDQAVRAQFWSSPLLAALR